jgi:hypothetical protein
MSAPGNSVSANPPAIDTRAGFVAALQWGIDHAVAQAARRIVCVDADFAEWPLDSFTAKLTPWLRLPQRRLVLLARHYDEVPRRWPRFTAWRRDWAHAIEAWQPAEGHEGDLPTLLLADARLSVQLVDAVHWRGRASLDARQARVWSEEIDVVLQRCEPAFAVSSLGL